MITDARSPIAESYRHLRTSLLLSSAGKPPKTILITSSQPAEGKTTTGINTAFMLAQTGAEVLMIDCDLRRPRLHAQFELPNTKGLTTWLSGEKNLDVLIQKCGQSSEPEGVDVWSGASESCGAARFLRRGNCWAF